MPVSVSSSCAHSYIDPRAASPTRIDSTVKRAEEEGNLPVRGHKNVRDFVRSIQQPRRIIILVPSGAAVDETIKNLSEHMEVRIIFSVLQRLFPLCVESVYILVALFYMTTCLYIGFNLLNF